MKTYLLVFLAILIGPVTTFANSLICYQNGTRRVVMKFMSQNPIPDHSFEKFQIHSSYGSVLFHNQDLGPQWLSIKNAGSHLDYEIKVQNAVNQPIAYVHLSLDPFGIFNGYQQYRDDSAADQLGVEVLNCEFALSE